MRRRGLLVLAAAAGLLLTSGTGALSSGSLDRGVQASVATDATAYLGYEAAFEVNESTANVSVTVRNNFDVDRLDVSITVENQSNTTTLGPGGSETFDYETVPCGDPISVESEGDGVDVELERSVEC